MVKIVTLCAQGLSRSVGMADVLKLHFAPVDVVPLGHRGNTRETLEMMFEWADKIIVMQEHYTKHVPDEHKDKVHICDVGADTYGGNNLNRRGLLISQCWNWLRLNTEALGIEEHFDRL